MSELDTRKTGGGQTVSFVQVRLESRSLLPEQLIALVEAVTVARDVDVRVEDHGTGPATQ